MATVAPPDRTLASLQIYRGVAAVMVVLYHLIGGVFLFAHSAIDFFFVLSGFIMLYVHRAQAGCAWAVRPFLVARFTRIFPLYWLVLAATVAYYVYEPAAWEHRLEPLAIVRAVALYDQLATPVVPVAWTLSYELVFYLVFTLYLACGGGAFAALAALWASLVVAQWTGLTPLAARLLLSPLMLEFFLGCVAAWLVLRFTPRLHGAWVVLVVIPALVMIFLAIHRHYANLAANLSLEAYGAPPRMTRHRVIVPVSGVHRGTLAALEYARSLSNDVTAVHVSIDPDDVAPAWDRAVRRLRRRRIAELRDPAGRLGRRDSTDDVPARRTEGLLVGRSRVRGRRRVGVRRVRVRRRRRRRRGRCGCGGRAAAVVANEDDDGDAECDDGDGEASDQ